MKKSRKPYLLVMGGRKIGNYKTLQDALIEARSININRLRSGGPEYVEQIRITYDQIGEVQRLVHEE